MYFGTAVFDTDISQRAILYQNGSYLILGDMIIL